MTEHDPLDLAGHEKAKREKKASEQLALLEEQDDLKWLMSDRRGRRVVWRLLDKTGIYRSSYSGNAEDTFFREGIRNVGLMLVGQIHASDLEDQFALMQRENKVDRAGNTKR